MSTEPLLPAVVGVKIDNAWQWFDLDHLGDAEDEINRLHMIAALWGREETWERGEPDA